MYSQGVPVERDVFDDEVADPAQSRAIESSLWEVEALRRHYKYAWGVIVSLVMVVCVYCVLPIGPVCCCLLCGHMSAG